MPTVMARSGFSDLLYPGLNKAYVLAYKAYPEEYNKFLNLDTSTKQKEEDSATVGFGLVPEKVEGRTPYYDEMQYVGKIEYVHKTYCMGFTVTEELVEDELYGVINQGPRLLAEAVKKTVDTLGAAPLNNAFSGSYLGVDGKMLCATDHPQKKAGGTQANRPTVDCDFDPLALQDATETIELWKDDNNLPLLMLPKWVVSSPRQRKIIGVTLGSEKEPGTADNDINAIREWELQRLILHYLTDEDAWFVLSRQQEHYMKWFWRIRPVFRNFDDPETGNAKYQVRFRASCGFTHWWGVYGSPGG